MSSTIDYYHKRRRKLLRKIMDSNGRENKDISCRKCGIEGYGDHEFHIDHVNKEDGYSSGVGGYQHLYNCIEDLEDGVDLQVLCRSCHDEKDDFLFKPEMEVET